MRKTNGLPGPVEVPPELAVRQLRHFLLVADQGSFRSAAGQAHRSQPAITKSVQAVEQLLGAPLFEPGHRTTLTRMGAACVPHVRELLLHYERTMGSLRSIASGDTGVLAIASISTLAMHWLPLLVGDFARTHPGVSVRLYDDNSRNIQRMVLAGEIDFGLCSPVSTDSRLHLTPLMRNAFGFVCRRDHSFAERRFLRWSALAGQPLIGTTAHRQIADPVAAAAVSRPLLRAENMLTLVALLQAGAGVTVLPETSVPTHASDLRFVPLRAPAVRREVSLMQLRDRTPSPPAATMIAALLARARAHHAGPIPISIA
jgi:DNA-binding transcriptional LysR family regulator